MSDVTRALQLRRSDLIANELRRFAERLTQLADIAERLPAFREQESREHVANEIELGADDIGSELHSFAVRFDSATDE
jgi:hypothetical protein